MAAKPFLNHRPQRSQAPIHASEDIAAAREKAVRVIEKLRCLRLAWAAELVEAAIEGDTPLLRLSGGALRRIRTIP